MVKTIKESKAIKVILIMVIMLGSLTGIIVDREVVAAQKISEDVLKWQDVMEEELAKYDLEDHVGMIMAITEIESGGALKDIMQSSESKGLGRNAIQDEKASIKQGVKHYSSVYKQAQEKGLDTDSVVQAYNYGTGFIGYVEDNGGKYSFEVAESFAKKHSNSTKTTYSNPLAVEKNGGWRWKYGNMFYVQLVNDMIKNTGVEGAGTTSKEEDVSKVDDGKKEPSKKQIRKDELYIEKHIVTNKAGLSTGSIEVENNLTNWFYVFSDEAKTWLHRAGWVMSAALLGYVSLFAYVVLTVNRGTAMDKLYTKKMIEESQTEDSRVWYIFKNSILAIVLMFIFGTGIYIDIMALLYGALTKLI